MTLPIQTDAYWDATADAYEANAEPFTSLFCHDAVALAQIEIGMTLLDVATGPGAVALAAARAGAVVTAIDFSQAMVDRVTARARGQAITGHRMDGQALDLPDAGFDRVVSVFGVPLFPDWRAGLREIARVLKPGGVAVVATAANPYGFGPNMLLAEARRGLFPDRPFAFEVEAMAIMADGDRLTDELEAAGLAAATIHARTHDFVMPEDFFERLGAMIAANPLLAGLDAQDAERVTAAAKADVESRADSGTVRLPGTAHVAVARKP